MAAVAPSDVAAAAVAAVVGVAAVGDYVNIHKSDVLAVGSRSR